MTEGENHMSRGGANTKLTILWVCFARILELSRSTPNLAGSERIERVRSLAEEGNNVYLIAADFEKWRYKINPNMHLVSVPIRNIPMISSVMYGLVLFLFLPLYLVKIRPDFVIADPSTALYLSWNPILSRLLKFKTTLDVRSTPVNSFTGTRAYLNRLYFNISIFVTKMMLDGMTIITPMMRDEVCHSFHINPKWVGILSGGISNRFLTYNERSLDRVGLREKFGLSGRFVIIYHGALRMRNGGLVETLKAMSLLKTSYPDITLFLLVGIYPKALHLLETCIKENAVQENVKFFGPVDFSDVPKYISMSDVGIVPLPNIPTWRHQQPLKLLEYMAMGKTMIVSDSPAHRALIGDNKNGIYVAHVTPEEIAQAIKYAYNNRKQLQEWGKIGKEIILEKYTWKKVNQELVEYLSKV
jgi:glycosyltransferase involved in cell wall biosynthesis